MHALQKKFVKRADWLKARNQYLCSTDTASIFGVGYAGTSAHTVWGQKTGLVEPPAESDALRLEIGRVSEDVIRRLFEKVQKAKIKRPGHSLFIHPKIPWLAASIDGTCCEDIPCPTCGGSGEVKEQHEYYTETLGCPHCLSLPVTRTAVVECKWVDNFQAHDWDNDQVPLKFQVQVQHQMEVLGLNYGYVVGLTGDELMIRLVPRNQRFIDAMLQRLKEFWACVQERRQPTIDGSYATTKFLQRLHPDDNGVAVWLPESLEVVADEIAALDPTIKRMKERQDQLQNLLRSCLGPHTYGVLPTSGRVFSWKTQEMAEHVRKASKSRVLRTHKALPRDVEKPTITVSDPTLERMTDGNTSTPATIEATDAGPGAERKPDGPADGPQGQNRGPDSA